MNESTAQTVPVIDLRGRFVPDVIEASDEWGANCGPTAIAAALGLTMREVKSAVAPSGTFQGYMGVRDLREAIARAGGQIVRQWSKPEKRELARTDGSPIVVVVRFCGPWDDIPNERVRARVQATHRHAFCYRHGIVAGQASEFGPGWVYDCNNVIRNEGRLVVTWAPVKLWRDDVLRELVPERGTGEIEIDWMAQVEKAMVP